MSARPALVLLVLGAALCPAADPVEFNRDIRPILSDNCFACHGHDASHRKAKLRLDVRADALAKEAFVPGKPEASELVKRLFLTDPDEVMPPPESHKTLSKEQKELLRRWVAEGATYQNHWSYDRPAKAAAPTADTAIDTLVEARLRAKGLRPVGEADRRTLARRLHLDLLGLPPTPEEVDAFVADRAPDAYARLVERLLASPHYGERLAQGWLDVVRYADTIGYHSDTPRNVWPYRDYVIRSFNQNKRFDRFTLEQVAGDLLPDADIEAKVGSGFNRLLLTTEEGGAQAKDYQQRMLTDRVRAIGAAWLGQTTGCAQCHDHKFDPFTQRDFYALGAFFADIHEPDIGRREEGLLVVTPADERRLAELAAAVTRARQALETARAGSARNSPPGRRRRPPTSSRPPRPRPRPPRRRPRVRPSRPTRRWRPKLRRSSRNRPPSAPPRSRRPCGTTSSRCTPRRSRASGTPSPRPNASTTPSAPACRSRW